MDALIPTHCLQRKGSYELAIETTVMTASAPRNGLPDTGGVFTTDRCDVPLEDWGS
jgi:hypothetical protein